MRFRRHRRGRKFREPMFWSRGCSSNSMGHGASYTAPDCDLSKVLSVDQLAVGDPEFAGQDDRYTPQRILWPTEFRLDSTSIASTRSIWWWCAVVMCDTALLGPIVTTPLVLGEILSGGSSNFPSAFDVLDFKQWMWTNQNTGGTNFPALSGNAYAPSNEHGPKDFDVRTKRKLQTSQCIAALWGTDLFPSGDSLPSATGWTLNWRMVRSTLYRRTPR